MVHCQCGSIFMNKKSSLEQNILQLKQIIAEQVFLKNTDLEIGFNDDPDGWIFNFRSVLMNGRVSNLISDIFYEDFKDQYPFQMCSLEIAGVPLVTSLMNKFYARGHEDVNAVFIRKSRKKTGLLKMIEGTLVEDQPLVLVDDIINSGGSFWRQIEVLDELGYKIDTVWSILQFRDKDYYQRFVNRGIKVRSLFELDDFTDVLSEQALVANCKRKEETPIPWPFTASWCFKSERPSYQWVVSKSQPVIDEDKLYFGSDNCIFWALNQSDGTVAWKYQVGSHAKRKSIFSSPALHGDLVLFGSYDGNFYALDKHTGKRVWMFLEADWIGSSPAVADDLGLVYVGLEFGLFAKRGGIVALDIKTGKKVWCDYSHPALTHCSPHYISERQEVVIGSNDGKVRLHCAKTGEVKWEFTTFGGSDFDPKMHGGFGTGDIKESFAYYHKQKYVICGSIDGFLYIIDAHTGHLVYHHKCEFGIWSTPVVYGKNVYFTSVDKHVRCINLETLELVFEKNLDSTRIFSSPTIISDCLYVGTNAGRLHEIDPQTGEVTGCFHARERITNSLVQNPQTGQYFLPTFANEIISLQRAVDGASPGGID